jgi:hypothetical protein
VGYTRAGREGTYDVKCYQAGGESTIIKLIATADGARTRAQRPLKKIEAP